MTKVVLLTTDAELDDWFRLADTKKQKIPVSKEALNKLLIDYGRMHEALRGSANFVVSTPQPPKRARATLG